MIISGVHHSAAYIQIWAEEAVNVYIYIHIFFLRFFSTIDSYQILNIVLYAIQQDLAVYLSYVD